MGVGGSTVIGTSDDGWCTLGDWQKIGDAGIVGCRSTKCRFCLKRTSQGVLRWVAIVAGGGVVRGVTTLGGGATSREVMLLGAEPPLEVALMLSLGVVGG